MFKFLLHSILILENTYCYRMRKFLVSTKIYLNQEKKFRVWWVLSNTLSGHNYLSNAVTSYRFALDLPCSCQFQVSPLIYWHTNYRHEFASLSSAFLNLDKHRVQLSQNKIFNCFKECSLNNFLKPCAYTNNLYCNIWLDEVTGLRSAPDFFRNLP